MSKQAVEKNLSLFETVTNAQKHSVTILVDGDNPEEGSLEYRYRVNGGPWTIWKQRTSIELTYLAAGVNKENYTEVAVSVPFAQ